MQKRFRENSLMSKEKITPYRLRHVFGLNVSAMVEVRLPYRGSWGMKNLEMTKVYVNLADEDIQASHAK